MRICRFGSSEFVFGDIKYKCRKLKHPPPFVNSQCRRHCRYQDGRSLSSHRTDLANAAAAAAAAATAAAW